jgi:hypothetical protein
MKKTFLFALMFATFISTELMASDASLCRQHHCVGIVDVGSSGSRLHFYVYDMGADQQPMNVEEKWSKKIKPGFSTLELQQTTIDTYLNDLFSNQSETDVPVYFYATAGMRLLSEPKQQAYYNAAKTWFSKQSSWRLIDAKTISGQDEGIYGWIAANYRLGTWNKTDVKPVGIMDMGGASVQITFPIDEKNAIDDLYIQQITLFNKPITLFSYSALGLGQTLTSQQFLNHANCFTQDYPLPSGILGQGDAITCQEDVASLVNGVHHVDDSVKPALTINASHEWYVMGGLAYLMQTSTFRLEDDHITGNALLEQANQALCQKNWDVLYAAYPERDTLYAECFNASYYYALMTQGYGLSPETPIHAMPADGSDWTLGAVLYPH